MADFVFNDDMWEHMQSDRGGQFASGTYEDG